MLNRLYRHRYSTAFSYEVIKHTRCKFVAACDIIEEKLNEFCDDYNIEHRYLDYRRCWRETISTLWM